MRRISDLNRNMTPQFDSMNETDVREIVVRPLLARLGYAHGTQANIRTEVRLLYDLAFLGRKKPRKDPPLAGRADYVCEAISFGRWVVEVKAPHEPLSRDDAEQAHTYCAHPEISATHFMLTNGREFRLYVTGDLQKPLLTWSWEQTDDIFAALQNVLSYDAVVARAGRLRYDMAKPLGRGLPSKVEVISGEVCIGEIHADAPMFSPNAIKGTIASITGGTLSRAEDGRLSLVAGYRSPMQQLSSIIAAAGLDRYEFISMDEYLSHDEATPSIFQNLTTGATAPGLEVPVFPGTAPMALPLGFEFAMYVNAVCYFDGRAIRGTLESSYDYRLIHTAASRAHPGFAQLPDRISATGDADFFVFLQV